MTRPPLATPRRSSSQRMLPSTGDFLLAGLPLAEAPLREAPLVVLVEGVVVVTSCSVPRSRGRWPRGSRTETGGNLRRRCRAGAGAAGGARDRRRVWPPGSHRRATGD